MSSVKKALTISDLKGPARRRSPEFVFMPMDLHQSVTLFGVSTAKIDKIAGAILGGT